ncbi:hypothetical protein ACOSP7_008950 [Xanthoceras sorbifolium]
MGFGSKIGKVFGSSSKSPGEETDERSLKAAQRKMEIERKVAKVLLKVEKYNKAGNFSAAEKYLEKARELKLKIEHRDY